MAGSRLPIERGQEEGEGEEAPQLITWSEENIPQLLGIIITLYSLDLSVDHVIGCIGWKGRSGRKSPRLLLIDIIIAEIRSNLFLDKSSLAQFCLT